jgi:hypothetical protein
MFAGPMFAGPMFAGPMFAGPMFAAIVVIVQRVEKFSRTAEMMFADSSRRDCRHRPARREILPHVEDAVSVKRVAG